MPPRATHRITVPAPPLDRGESEDGGEDVTTFDPGGRRVNAAVETITEIGDVTQLADPQYSDWLWWVYRMKTSAEMQRDPRGKARAIVTKVTGPLDIMDIQARFGGGVFEFWGYFDGTLRMRLTYEIEGARKSYEPAPLPAAPAPVVHAPPAAPADRLAVILENQQAQLARIEARLAVPTESTNGITVKDIMALMPLFSRGEGGGQVIGEVVAAFKQGVDLRGTIEGGPEKSTLEVVLEKLSPALERIAQGIMARPRGTGPARQPAARPPASESRAEVIESAPPSASGNHRWLTAAESLAAAIAANDEPGDFVVTLERILNPQEFGMLRFASSDDVIKTVTEMDPAGALPILRTEPARNFIDAALAEIRSPAESGDDDPSA